MSDMGRTVMWVVVAIVVVAVVVWWFVSTSHRREHESRRFEAGELRATAVERPADVPTRQDRAAVSTAVAGEARADADRTAGEAERPAVEAERLDDPADEVDEGDEVDEEQEDDLADAVNPFAPPADLEPLPAPAETEADAAATARTSVGTGRATAQSTETEGDPAMTQSTRNHDDGRPVDEATDATDATEAPDAADATDVPSAAAADEQKVSVPALADAGDVVVDGGTPANDPGDHRGQPWATTPGQHGPGDSDEPADEGLDVDMAPHSHASDEATEPDDAVGGDRTEPRRQDAEPTPDLGSAAAPSQGDTTDSLGRDDSPGDDAGAPEPAASARRESEFDEVVDGGFGLGSAAPIGDGAQPLGHAIKGRRDGMTFVGPDDPGYDESEPDVWFYNEDAARRAGFHRDGE